MKRERNGLTLIEVIVAMLVFAIGGLGLAAGSAIVVKQIGLSTLRSNAMTIAQSRAERAIALGCGTLTSGEESKLGIRSVWTVNGGAAATLEQTLERKSALGMHSDRFLSAVPCD
ncbi:MAG: prepilin-type N-terminal cleavage/methylation domain-containing protein [Gemmatimonadales bacterium]